MQFFIYDIKDIFHDLFNAFQRKEGVCCFQHTAFNSFLNRSIQTEKQKLLLVIACLVYSILRFYFCCMAMYSFTALIEVSQSLRYPFLSSLHAWTAEQSALNSFTETHSDQV